MTYEEVLSFLYSQLPMYQRVGKSAYKVDLSNTWALLRAIDDPQRSLKCIHIAGTNGKGSSAHAIAAVLQAAGYRTGLYTSPHLKSFIERIRIDGQEIPQDAVVALFKEMKPAIEEIKPSFFEVTVAMAFLYFHKESVDYCVVETGLGGRLDSTNVIDPIVSLITMIGMDHTNILGDSLQQIAREKAGIIKENRPVVLGTHQKELYSIFTEVAAEKNAPLVFTDDLKVEIVGYRDEFVDLNIEVEGESYQLKTDMAADYFIRNIPGILGVITSLNENGIKVPIAAIKQGFSNIKKLTGLKGRWQEISEGPKVVADISHNAEGIQALVHQLNRMDYDHLHIIFGTVTEKSIPPILNLLPSDVFFYWTEANVPRALPVGELQQIATEMGLIGSAYPDVNSALASAKNKAQKNDLILITGSTFVVAEIEGL